MLKETVEIGSIGTGWGKRGIRGGLYHLLCNMGCVWRYLIVFLVYPYRSSLVYHTAPFPSGRAPTASVTLRTLWLLECRYTVPWLPVLCTYLPVPGTFYHTWLPTLYHVSTGYRYHTAFAGYRYFSIHTYIHRFVVRYGMDRLPIRYDIYRITAFYHIYRLPVVFTIFIGYLYLTILALVTDTLRILTTSCGLVHHALLPWL